MTLRKRVLFKDFANVGANEAIFAYVAENLKKLSDSIDIGESDIVDIRISGSVANFHIVSFMANDDICIHPMEKRRSFSITAMRSLKTADLGSSLRRIRKLEV